MAISLLLVDDQPLFREGLRHLFGQTPDLRVIGEAANGDDACALSRDLAPDVVLMDCSMPGGNGVEATRKILDRTPSARVVALSGFTNQQVAQRMIHAGAAAYIEKDVAFDVLVEAVRVVHCGGRYLSPAVARGAMVTWLRGDADAPKELTPRERDVLRLLAQGHRSKDIAEKLELSPKTIESHRTQIMRRLGLRSVAELTKYAIREGLSSLDD